jgi:hypothetical protein
MKASSGSDVVSSGLLLLPRNLLPSTSLATHLMQPVLKQVKTVAKKKTAAASFTHSFSDYALSLDYQELPKEWKQKEAVKWQEYFDKLKIKVESQR